MTLTITYHQAVQAGACTESLGKMRDSDIIGGDWGRFGRAMPIKLADILDVLGMQDTLWALDALGEDRLIRLLASDFAAHVHHLWCAEYPADHRPAEAIRVSRMYAQGLASGRERSSARAAARAAEADAARTSAYAAARASASAATDAAAFVSARASARASASVAAYAAAYAAARASAYDVERSWQTKHLRDVLTGHKRAGTEPISMAGGES